MDEIGQDEYQIEILKNEEFTDVLNVGHQDVKYDFNYVIELLDENQMDEI